MPEPGYFAIGNEELADMPPLKIGEAILCPQCGEAHIVRGGIKDGIESDTLLFYTCDEASYLAGVHGKNVMRRFFDEKE